MNRLRDDPTEFEGAIDAAARALGLAPLFVEKDYWVTQVLRALNTRHPGWFVFKGGTSLSKGYGLIERFSEDVDILVSPAKDDSARTREELLLAMTESVAAELGLEWQRSCSRTRKDGPPRRCARVPTNRPGQHRRPDGGPWRHARDRPTSGYPDSPAFTPAGDSELRRWLEARYAEASELMPARTTGRWPTFGQIMARVAESRTLL